MRDLKRVAKAEKPTVKPSADTPTGSPYLPDYAQYPPPPPGLFAGADGPQPVNRSYEGEPDAPRPKSTLRSSVKALLLMFFSVIALLLINAISAFKVIKPALAVGLLTVFLGTLLYALIRLCVRLIRRGYLKLAGMLMLCILGIGLYSGASAYVVSFDPAIEEALASRLPPDNNILFWVPGPGGGVRAALNEAERRVGIEEVRSSWLKSAIIAVEDERLPSRIEGPVDLIAAGRAALSNLKGKRQGGSTIQLQLAKLLMGKLKTKLSDKDTQTLLAIRLDQRFPEIDELISLYCNVCSIAGDRKGIAAAAADLFGVYDLRALTLSQSALLAGMLRSPATYDPSRHPDNAKARRDLILGKMHDQRFIGDEQYREALSEPIKCRAKEHSIELFVRAAKDAHRI